MINPLYYYWAVLLAQNYAFTYTSRARNSASLTRHFKAAMMSNGIWFISQIIVVGQIVNMITGKYGLAKAIFVALYYTVFTLIGSLWAHHQALKKEKGKTAVGASEKYAQITVQEWREAQATLSELRSMNGII